MNKRLLRRITVQAADANIILSANQLRESDIRYILRGRTETVSNESILQLTFYSKDDILRNGEMPEFRVFFAENDYITQRFGGNGTKWLTGALPKVMEYGSDDNRYNYCWHKNIMMYDSETIDAIEGFIGSGETPLAGLEDYQNDIKAARLRRKHQVIKDRIDAKMRLIDDIPDDFMKWLDTTGFGDRRYLFYRYKNVKKKQGYCTICKSSVSVEQPRHNRYGICPNCGGKVMFKVESKSKRVCDSKYISLFQKTPGGFVVRYFNVHRKYEDFSKPVFSVFETNRDFYEGDSIDAYIYDKFKQTNEVRWCETSYVFGYKPPFLLSYRAYHLGLQSTVYGSNLSGVIADTKYRYSAIYEYATRSPGAVMYVHDYLIGYEKYPYIEYMTKLRLYKLAEDLIRQTYTPDASVNSLDDILGGMGKQYLKIMQETGGGRDELELAQKLSEAHIPFDAEYLCWVRDTYRYEAAAAVKCAGYASLERIAKYCSQYANRDNDLIQAFKYWHDYINACEKLDYDLANDFVLFPRDLKQAHDSSYKRVENLKKRGRHKLLNNMTKRLAGYLAELQERYGYENDEYAVVVPSNLNEIVKEGHALHHCVGTYAEQVGSRERVILFLRRKSDIKKPFYTMEISLGRMTQCRGKMNCAMTDEVKSFVGLFEKHILFAENNRNIEAG